MNMEERLKEKIAESGTELRARHDDETIKSVIADIEAKEGKEYEITSEILRTMLYST